jgi:hypothetical protein
MNAVTDGEQTAKFYGKNDRRQALDPAHRVVSGEI